MKMRSMGDRNSKLLIIGRLPPPVGGVTIHLQRLCKLLNAANIKYKLSYHKPNIFKLISDVLTHPRIHINLSDKMLRCLIIILSRFMGKQTFVTFHGKYNFINLFDRCTLILAQNVFVLNSKSRESAIKFTNALKVHKISAFIPPIEEELIVNTLDESIISMIKNTSWNSVFCTNAHNLVFDAQGFDLYGIDLLINIFVEKPDSLLIISDPSSKLSKHYGGLFKNIVFIRGIHSFVQVISLSDTLIRATSTDGDSLSVKEALYLNKKVIASDCVDRPLDCILFKTRSISSLQEAILESLKVHEIAQNRHIENGGEFLVNMLGNNLSK